MRYISYRYRAVLQSASSGHTVSPLPPPGTCAWLALRGGGHLQLTLTPDRGGVIVFRYPLLLCFWLRACGRRWRRGAVIGKVRPP